MESMTYVADSSIGSVTTPEQLDALLELSVHAKAEFQKYTQSQVDNIFKQCAIAANQSRIHLAQMAVEEAGMGSLEDKTLKNHFSAETVYNAYKKMKTCGIIEEDCENGYALYAEPVGILAAIVPCTNPTSTTIFKCLIALKTRNCLVLAPHPRTVKCSIMAAKIIRDAAVAAGAPKNCILWFDKASIDLCTQLMRHPKVDMIVATGAGGLIKAAYSSGKPCIGGGAGNTPVIIDETADIPLAVNSILLSKTFDNGMICASEQAVVAVRAVADKVEQEFIKRGGFFLKDEADKDKLAKVLFKDNAALNPDAVGQPAYKLATMANIENVPYGIRVILAKLDKVGHDEPLSKEKLCPCLGFFVADDYDEALQIALTLVRFGGLGHTSVLYTNPYGSQAKHRIKAFESLMPTGRALICMPTSQGAIGGLFNPKQNPSMSLGCGSWGGNSSAEGLQPKHLLNYKQIAQRKVAPIVFMAPDRIESGFDSTRDAFRKFISEPKPCQTPPKHFGVIYSTSDDPCERPLLDYISNLVDAMAADCADSKVTLTKFPVALTKKSDYFFLKASDVTQLAEQMMKLEVDALVAIGNAHIIDAAKLIRVYAEDTTLDWDMVGTRFMNLTQRIVELPKFYTRIRNLICVSTAPDTGAEMSPYALVCNDTSKMVKFPHIVAIVDPLLVPDMAVLDFALPCLQPKEALVSAGCSALSNALESLVSLIATEQSKTYSEKAFKLLAENLMEAVQSRSKDAIKNCHQAAADAGLAAGNAFLGLAESLAHQLTMNFKFPNGLAKMTVLCQIIMFNSEDAPSKLASSPAYERPKAKEQYAAIVRKTSALGISETCSDDECLKILISYISDLKLKFKIPTSLKDYGVDEKEYLSKVDSMALAAFDDQFTGTNPRYPLVTELVQILLDAYEGNINSLRYDEAYMAAMRRRQEGLQQSKVQC